MSLEAAIRDLDFKQELTLWQTLFSNAFNQAHATTHWCFIAKKVLRPSWDISDLFCAYRPNPILNLVQPEDFDGIKAVVQKHPLYMYATEASACYLTQVESERAQRVRIHIWQGHEGCKHPTRIIFDSSLSTLKWGYGQVLHRTAICDTTWIQNIPNLFIPLIEAMTCTLDARTDVLVQIVQEGLQGPLDLTDRTKANTLISDLVTTYQKNTKQDTEHIPPKNLDEILHKNLFLPVQTLLQKWYENPEDVKPPSPECIDFSGILFTYLKGFDFTHKANWEQFIENIKRAPLTGLHDPTNAWKKWYADSNESSPPESWYVTIALTALSQQQRFVMYAPFFTTKASVHNLSPEMQKALYRHCMKTPGFIKQFCTNFMMQKYMRYTEGDPQGKIDHNFSNIIRDCVALDTLSHIRTPSSVAKKVRSVWTSSDTAESITLNPQDFKDYTVLGRSLRKDERRVKIQKQKESPDALFHEAQMIRILQEEKVWSTLPTNPRVFTITPIPQEIRAKISLSLSDDTAHVLEARCKASYDIYINSPDIPVARFRDGMRRFLRDGAYLVRSGLLPITVAMYHNESRNRSYLPLNGWINSTNDVAGRLEAIDSIVRFSNAGIDGIRDVGDALLEEEVIKNPELKSRDLNFEWEDTWEIKQAKLRGNALAELALVQTLLIQSRLRARKEVDWENEQLCQEIAEWGIEGMAAIMCGYSGYDYQTCYEFSKECGIDWLRWSKQVQFWIHNNERSYVGYLLKKELPHDLFNNTIVEFDPLVDLAKCKNWDPKLGHTTSGELDIGGFNGNFPITEEEKRWHILLFALCAAEVSES